jgi:hypothetical protein
MLLSLLDSLIGERRPASARCMCCILWISPKRQLYSKYPNKFPSLPQLISSILCIFKYFRIERERPYQHVSTASRLLSAVKHVPAWSVLRWGTYFLSFFCQSIFFKSLPFIFYRFTSPIPSYSSNLFAYSPPAHYVLLYYSSI